MSGGAGYSLETSNTATSGASKGDSWVNYRPVYGTDGISNMTLIVFGVLAALVIYLLWGSKGRR